MGDSGYVEALGAKNSREVFRASVPNSTIYKDAKSIVTSLSNKFPLAVNGGIVSEEPYFRRHTIRRLGE